MQRSVVTARDVRGGEMFQNLKREWESGKRKTSNNKTNRRVSAETQTINRSQIKRRRREGWGELLSVTRRYRGRIYENVIFDDLKLSGSRRFIDVISLFSQPRLRKRASEKTGGSKLPAGASTAVEKETAERDGGNC